MRVSAEAHESELFASTESDVSHGIERRLRRPSQSKAKDGESNYEHMRRQDRDAGSDSDDSDGVAKLTMFADRKGNEFAMFSHKRGRIPQCSADVCSASIMFMESHSATS
eukprot:5202149-Amphidinium_carterae.1